MKSKFLAAVVVLLSFLLGSSAYAEFNEVNFESGTLFNFPGNGLNYTAGSGLRGIQSFKVNDTDNRFELGVTANTIFIMSSSDKSGYTVTGNQCNGAMIECQSDKSVLTISCSNGAADHTIFIVPGAANTCSGSGGSGGGGGGGGGGSAPPPPPPAAIPATPATPATPAVPGVSPAVPATPATPAQPAHKFTKVLKKGASGAEVRELQERLKELGFLPAGHQPTTFFGNLTQKALQDFQKANGLPPSGQMTTDTMTVLNGGTVQSPPAAPAASGSFKSFLGIGSRSAEVKALQDKLKALGYLDASVDSTGFFGRLTAEAVKKFQAANGISSVGYVGPATRAVLNK